ncbi:carbohydrate kinase [Blastococcus sp. TML/M2B]|uniref:FGGY family carbohydrate kinase n=1 Tax=unclassified Blastococcus TaxID=2619396 RepID=UPI00190B01DE|nr:MULTISPECIES: FGGY family carbohydrate kinase [unclassified Blastococcus]MBN1093722.1 carbohydrate kinase [Blastococcus sp. TML/M2B]MBN1096156.1 carbohydrate kinase [Blastococcus sp. TML/C7B]
MTEPVFLGADVGTSGLKLVALDAGGVVVAEAERDHAVDRPRPGWAETDVRVWRAALEAALGDVVPALGGRPVGALGLSGQMHGAVLVDAAGRPVRPAVLWPDGRAAAELARWRRLPEADRAALANPLVPGMTGPVLAWLAAHEPGVLERAAAVLLPKDALRAALVPGADVAVTDRSDASATLLWDVVADGWSAAATAAAGVAPELLPEVRPGTAVVGTTALGGAEVPVVVGGADTPLALLAAGTTGGLQINLGTGIQVLRPASAPHPAADPSTHTYADVEGGWYAMAALQNGGSAWAWVREVLGLGWDGFFDAAAAGPPGAGGALFRPFLTGERGGIAGPDDRGGWTGLSATTTRVDLARAAVEGVAFAVAAAVRSLDLRDDGTPVVVTGGGARPAVVRQVLADVLGRPVGHLPLRSASAIGAAVLAARGVGVDVVPRRRPEPPVRPRSDARLADAARRWSGSAG